MGLRDYLQSLALGAQGAEQGASALANIRQQADLEAFAQEAPGLLASGDLNTVAARAAGMGQMAPLTKLFDASMEAQKPGDQPFTKQELKAQGLDDEKAQIAAAMPYKRQVEFLNNLESRKKTQLQESELGLQYQAEQRRVAKEGYQKFKDTNSIFKPLEKEFNEDEAALKKVDQAFKAKTIPGDAIVLNFIARKMADEKGPLANQDIVRLKGATVEERYNEAMNWLNNSVKSTAPEARKAYKQLLDMAKNSHQESVRLKLNTGLAAAIYQNPDIRDNPAELKRLEGFARRRGYSGITFNEDGDPEVVVSKKTAPANPINPETGAPDIDKLEAQIDLIQDAAIKPKAQAALQRIKAKKVLDPEELNRFYQRMLPYLPKK